MSDPRYVEVILIEDNPHDAELAIRALKKHRLVNSVTHITDGAAAAEELLASATAADGSGANGRRVVLLDLNLPKVSGMEILERMQQLHMLDHTPVIVLLSSPEDQALIASKQLGVKCHIVKPLSFEKFIAAISHLGFSWALLTSPDR